MRESETYEFSVNPKKHEEPINKEINDFMEDFEKKKQTKTRPDQRFIDN